MPSTFHHWSLRHTLGNHSQAHSCLSGSRRAFRTEVPAVQPSRGRSPLKPPRKWSGCLGSFVLSHWGWPTSGQHPLPRENTTLQTIIHDSCCQPRLIFSHFLAETVRVISSLCSPLPARTEKFSPLISSFYVFNCPAGDKWPADFPWLSL